MMRLPSLCVGPAGWCGLAGLPVSCGYAVRVVAWILTPLLMETEARIQECRLFGGSPGGLNPCCGAVISWSDGSCLVVALALSYCVGAAAQVCCCGPGWSIL
ncbi:hypothetical protein Nepgr_016346 [Nepenthes gracilis]|uniref:Uncharacterized protein n=1 Tax=Nepenthes gracilis TaxID=150966 RepID=A0AAD3XSE8_NEPGR|nr:hypothetical protein Nepgr_016346 [Nepenthes gracilis]